MAGTGVVIPEKPIRFADWELNAAAFELRRGRRTVKLERIPLQVLLILIEHGDKVVTREEIAEQIWGKDVFLDVDNGINTAIRKIRQVLNDDPQRPRFVETIPGTGYRCIAAVEKSEGQTWEAPANWEQRPPVNMESTTAPNSVATEAKAREHIWSRFGAGRLGALVVGVLCVVGAGGWLSWRHFAGDRQAIRSIAVIPLQNLSGDPSQDYFADGMTEELITELARIQSLRVISHTSVMDYKGTKKHLPEIARELGVDAILEGSVIRENNNVRVTVQLLEGPADRHLWGEEYERPLNGVLNLQRDVGRAIAQEVRAKLTTAQSPVRPAHVVIPAANDDYMKGRIYFDNGYTKPDSLKKARQYFEQSIQIDPNFAQAYAGLANTYISSAFVGVLDRDWAYRSAKQAIAKAMELDDSVGEAHDTLGTLKLAFEGDSEGAEREYNRAIALAPSYSCAHEDRANLLASLGRREEALAELAKIDQLDFGFGAASTEAGVYYTLRDYPNLIDASRRLLLLDPSDSSSHRLLGVGFEGAGKPQEAISEYKKAMDLSGGDSDSVLALAHAYSAVGQKVQAEKILRDLERKLRGAGSPYTMAQIYAGLGERDKAFEFLEKAFAEKSSEMSGSIKTDEFLDSLRSDPRFQSLLHRMGLNA